MSMGIIGGADGPTMVTIITTGAPWAAVAVGVLVLAAIILAVVLWRRRKK